LPAPPELARTLFGDRLPLAVRYAERLAGDGVEWGIIGPRESDRLWERHLLNCVAVGALIPPDSMVVDVGSGAGLPGVVLAIARPDLRLVLVEPMLRRAAFLESVLTDLELTGVEIQRTRAEELTKSRPAADVVTARAVARVDRLAELAAPLLRPSGELLAIKGNAIFDEMAGGWHGVRRANMTLGAALFSIRPVEGAKGATGANVPVHPPAGWLPGAEATCEATWDEAGSVIKAEPQGAVPLALVLRLGRTRSSAGS
jgi:16S rRNA (guanine(527)-N(7))-methyltransferase RsmG